ncbi:polysialyltransferase family glycosyltransferase [Photobacterium leiognathi]|uniref:polysialyltransferase family glycosyltransferase n=1 Tax=Photobacterium leiognathi TaxID=553611 RepID=UPI0027394A3E|nr:polysialyltransferase family glycosyltransferase [Photobacterium leiognathi]
MVKQFSKSEIILLDDGSKTLSIQNKFIENGKGNNIFTFYDLTPLNGQVVYKNEYSRVFDLLSDEFFINDKKVLFLGSKLSEVGIINESYYLSLIKQISEYYSGNKILYVPHRGERKEKVNKISRMLNIKVLNVDYPIELFGLYNNELPFKVSSFYSTALLTMKEIYKIEADAFVFDYNNSEHKDAIKETYDYYKDKLNMINFSKHD